MADWRPPTESVRARLDDSRTWFESGGRDGAPFVAHHEDLSQMDLAEQTLVDAQLQGANLRGARLDSALLMQAALDGADFSGAYMFQCDVSKASAAEAAFDDAKAMRSRWTRTSLTRTTLQRADLTDAHAQGLQALRCDMSGARLKGADLRGASVLGSIVDNVDLAHAWVDGLIADPTSLASASGLETARGEWISFTLRTRPERHVASRAGTQQWEDRVADSLRTSSHVRRVHLGLPEVDFIAELTDGRLVAVEAHTGEPSREALLRKAARADLVVVPDDSGPAPPIAENKVVRLSDLDRRLGTLSTHGFGASAIVLRSARRLRPYWDLLARTDEDPTALSRLSAYVDSGHEVMLNSADRQVARQLPAHLDSTLLGQASSWARAHRDDLLQLLDLANSIQHGLGLELRGVEQAAQLALDLEEQSAGFEGSE